MPHIQMTLTRVSTCNVTWFWHIFDVVWSFLAVGNNTEPVNIVPYRNSSTHCKGAILFVNHSTATLGQRIATNRQDRQASSSRVFLGEAPTMPRPLQRIDFVQDVEQTPPRCALRHLLTASSAIQK